MKRTAAVAVIGGGVIGASVAYHLARAGMRDVVILDRARGPGGGSTGKATGGFRAQFATAINVRLSLLSRDKLRCFVDDTGVDPGYKPVGYLWIAHNEGQLRALLSAQAVQLAEGLTEAREIEVSDIADLNPFVSLDGIVGGVFCPTDGYLAPLEILRGYLEAGRRLGVTAQWNAEVVGLDHDGARVTRVRTSQGDIEVERVVNAAGPWARAIAAMAGVELPVSALRRQVAVTYPTSAISPAMPMTIFTDTGFHLRARDGRALLCWPTFDEGPGDSELRVDDTWIDAVSAMTRSRVPALRDVGIDRDKCYAGYYEMSPDHHAIIGVLPVRDNLFFVNGSSGHGVMHSPALGEIAADMITGRDPAVDASALRASRFDEGAPVKSVALL